MSRPLRDDFGNQIHTRRFWRKNEIRRAGPSHADQDPHPGWDDEDEEDEDSGDDEEENE